MDEAQGDAPDGVWLMVPRAGSGLVGITYAEALQVALATAGSTGSAAAATSRACSSSASPRGVAAAGGRR